MLIALCTLAVQSLVPHLAVAALTSVCLAVGVTWFGLVIRDWWREIDALLMEDDLTDCTDDEEGERW